MKDRKQQLINNLERIEQLSKSLAFTNVKNIANDEFTCQGAEIAIDIMREIRTLAVESTGICSFLIRSGEIKPL